MTARYVVGCDGGRSVCRQQMGLELHRKHQILYFIIGDVLLKSPLTFFADASSKMIHIWPSPKGLFALLPLPSENAYRLVMQAPEGYCKDIVRNRILN